MSGIAPRDGEEPPTGQLAADLARLTATTESRDTVAEREMRQQEARDRSAVTGTVMAVFATAILASLLALVFGGVFGGAWTTVGPLVVDVLKSVVLPVVTLVLGYYFGRGGKS